jgi:hypothetical protein
MLEVFCNWSNKLLLVYYNHMHNDLLIFFRKCMSRNRYMAILQYLHLVDNTLSPPTDHADYDRLYKVSIAGSVSLRIKVHALIKLTSLVLGC